MTSPRPTVNPEDAARADGVLRAWAADCRERRRIAPAREQRALRGLLLAAFADCRADAYADALLDYRAASTDPITTLAGEKLADV
jgi:hypothetical protein